MRRINYLLACIVVVMTCATPFAARMQGEVARPDLIVRRLELKGKLVTVYVMNKGKADAAACYVMLSGSDASESKTPWKRRYDFGRVALGATDKMVFDISPHSAEPGTSLRAVIDSSERVGEMDETNNMRELLVPKAEDSGEAPVKPAPAPPPPAPAPMPSPPPPAPQKISPDIAAADIYFNDDGLVVAVLKNVGDRDYYAKHANIKDSFKRVITLKRIVHLGTTSYTEDLKTRTMGNAQVGKSFNGAYPRSKNVAGATKYTWILTIEGEDPNAKNNTFTMVQKVTKID